MTSTFRRIRDNEQLLALCGSTMLVMAGQGVVSPVLPLFARDFGVSTTIVGLTFTVFGVARLIMNVPVGSAADRYGRRILLIGGPAVTAIGMFASAAAPTIWWLLAARFVAGAGSAMYMTGAQIFLIDISTDETRARFIAANQAALLIGVSLGPGLGGLVASQFGLRAPFTVVGIIAVLTTIYSAVRLPETRPESISNPSTADGERAERPSVDLRQFLVDPKFVALGLVSFSVFAARSGPRQTLAPLLAIDELGMTTASLGLLLTVTALMAFVVIGPSATLADRFGRRAVIVPTGVLAGVGVAMIAGTESLIPFIIGNIVFSLGTGVSGPAPAAYLAEITPPELRGRAMGMYRSAGDLGIVVAPPGFGLLADLTSIRLAMWVGAFVLAAPALWFGVVAKRTGTGGPPARPSVAA